MPEKSASSIYAGRNIILRSKEPDYRICTTRWTGCCPGKTRVENSGVRQFLNDFLHAAYHELKTVVVELVGSIGGGVIMRVAKRRGIRNHDGGITPQPE